MKVLFVLMITMLSGSLPGNWSFDLPDYQPHQEAGTCEAAGSQAYRSVEDGRQSRLMPHWSAM